MEDRRNRLVAVGRAGLGSENVGCKARHQAVTEQLAFARAHDKRRAGCRVGAGPAQHRDPLYRCRALEDQQQKVVSRRPRWKSGWRICRVQAGGGQAGQDRQEAGKAGSVPGRAAGGPTGTRGAAKLLAPEGEGSAIEKSRACPAFSMFGEWTPRAAGATACASRRTYPATDPSIGLPRGRIPEDAVQKAQTLMPVLLPVHPHKLFHQLLFGFHGAGSQMMQSMGRTLMQVGFS